MRKGMRKGIAVNALLVLAIVVIVGVALGLDARRTEGGDERFVGSDSAATSRIEHDHPGYKPWFQPFYAPTSKEIESGLFALQAALGGIALGYTFGALRERRRCEAAGSPAAGSPVELQG